MGFQYEIHYRSGDANVVTNALSRIQGAELLALAVSTVTSNSLDLIKASYQSDNNVQDVLNQLEQGQ